MKTNDTRLIQVSNGRFVNESEISSIICNGDSVITFCKDGTTHTMSFTGAESTRWWEMYICKRIGEEK